MGPREAILQALVTAFGADGEDDIKVTLPEGRPGAFMGGGPSYDRVWRGLTNTLKAKVIKGAPLTEAERIAASLASIRGAVRFGGPSTEPYVEVRGYGLAEARRRVRRAASVYRDHAIRVRRDPESGFWTALEGEARKGEARKGEARKGEARKGEARKGEARKVRAR